MEWEFWLALSIGLLGVGGALVVFQNYPLVSMALILGAWLALTCVVARLERRERLRKPPGKLGE